MSSQHHQLAGLVHSEISIDQFAAQAGSDEEIIVVGFRCEQQLAAHDLHAFVTHSTVKIVQSEPSPGSDDDGKWYVFVEFARRPSFWQRLQQLLNDLENITGKVDWRCGVYGRRSATDLSTAQRKHLVPLSGREYRQRRGTDNITEHFAHSDLSDLVVNNHTVTFCRNGQQLCYDLVDHGEHTGVTQRQRLAERTLDLQQTCSRAHALRSMLGAGWTVSLLESFTVVQHAHSNYLVVLR